MMSCPNIGTDKAQKTLDSFHRLQFCKRRNDWQFGRERSRIELEEEEQKIDMEDKKEMKKPPSGPKKSRLAANFCRHSPNSEDGARCSNFFSGTEETKTLSLQEVDSEVLSGSMLSSRSLEALTDEDTFVCEVMSRAHSSQIDLRSCAPLVSEMENLVSEMENVAITWVQKDDEYAVRVNTPETVCPYITYDSPIHTDTRSAVEADAKRIQHDDVYSENEIEGNIEEMEISNINYNDWLNKYEKKCKNEIDANEPKANTRVKTYNLFDEEEQISDKITDEAITTNAFDCQGFKNQKYSMPDYSYIGQKAQKYQEGKSELYAYNQYNLFENNNQGNNPYRYNSTFIQSINTSPQNYSLFQPSNNQYQPGNNQFQQGNNQYQPGNNQFQQSNNQYQQNNNQFQLFNGLFKQSDSQFEQGNNIFQQGYNTFQQDNSLFQHDGNRYQQYDNALQPSNTFKHTNHRNCSPLNRAVYSRETKKMTVQYGSCQYSVTDQLSYFVQPIATADTSSANQRAEPGRERAFKGTSVQSDFERIFN